MRDRPLPSAPLRSFVYDDFDVYRNRAFGSHLEKMKTVGATPFNQYSVPGVIYVTPQQETGGPDYVYLRGTIPYAHYTII